MADSGKKHDHIAPFVLSIIALLVSMAGVIYQQTQTTVSIHQKELAVHSVLIERNARILELLLQYPDVREFFYDNSELPEDKKLLGRTMTLAEMWTDFFEQVLIQEHHLPPIMAVTWKKYAADMHSSSTAIREYFAESCGWYVLELRELWGGCEQ